MPVDHEVSRCMCGDSQCPSCGLAQGTLDGDDLSPTAAESALVELRQAVRAHFRLRTLFHEECSRHAGRLTSQQLLEALKPEYRELEASERALLEMAGEA